MTLEQVRGGWEELVAELRQSQPTLGIFLNGAELVACERNVLRRGFDAADRFPMSQVVSGEAPAPAVASKPQQDPAVKSVLETFDGELV